MGAGPEGWCVAVIRGATLIKITWPAFLADLERGIYKDRYTSEEKPDVSSTPVPRFELLNIDAYGIIRAVLPTGSNIKR